MKISATLLATLLVLAVTSTAQAFDMVAGPLIATGTDHCSCEIANVSTHAFTIEVLGYNSNGSQVLNSGPIALGPGQSVSYGVGSAGQWYCKFHNAAPAYFRAAMACWGTPDSSDNVALPAR